MSAHPHTLHIPPPEKLVPGKYTLSTVFLSVGAIGLILSIVSALFNPTQFAYSWFFSFYYYFTIALGALFWVLLHHVSDAGWGVIVRRVWENILGLFPILFLLILPLMWPEFRNILWKWGAPENAGTHQLALREGYLNPSFFYTRVGIYFAFFIMVGLYYRRSSMLQDIDGNPVLSRRMIDWSALFMVIFGVLETFASFDWLMGLDWRWSSSLFGAYNFGVCAQAGMAAAIVLVAIFRKAGFLAGFTFEHSYLMGKLLFGFTILWAYFAFGQFLLIWYANIPEESIFYNEHNRGHWEDLSYLIIIGKFAFPVIYLLAQDTKKSLRALTFIAAWILFMHGIELYWFIMPYAHEETILPTWHDLVAFVTITSILGFVYMRLASAASLFPTRDPRLVESLTVTN